MEENNAVVDYVEDIEVIDENNKITAGDIALPALIAGGVYLAFEGIKAGAKRLAPKVKKLFEKKPEPEAEEESPAEDSSEQEVPAEK